MYHKSSMKTPLRYPGGKAKFAPYFSNFIDEMGIKDAIFVEPFCGGAGAAIKLLLARKVKKIYINDFDRSIYAFWHTILNDSEKIIKKIRRAPVTIEQFDKQRLIQKRKDSVDLFTLGFSTFFLNRTAFSGVLTGGPIGGRAQNGPYMLGCRFNKEDLIQRIRLLSRHKKQIKIFNKDAIDFLTVFVIKKLPKSKTIFYIDPPYFEKGVYLYKNSYSTENHKVLESTLRETKKTIFVSYDNRKEIKEIYSSWQSHLVDVPHFAGKYKLAKEIIFYK